MLDADGLPNEERVEFQGASSRALSYRILRYLETWSIRRADAVTVRTTRAVAILSDRTGVQRERFHVVRNARDEHDFKPMSHKKRTERRLDLGIINGPLLVYAGSSLSGKYQGTAMLQFFREVRALRPDSSLLLLMPCLDEARALLSRNKDIASACILSSVAPEEIASSIGAADLGLCLIRPTYSMQAASPIKLAEYLLCGVPVLATAGVGENEATLEPAAGLCISDTGKQALAGAAKWFVERVLPNRELFRDRCRAAGLHHFSLDAAVSELREGLLAALICRDSGQCGS
jgi:glycosyltransferase involved in cell wall biosynthesis